MTKARDISRYGLGVGIQSAGSVVTGVGITQLNFIGAGNTFRVSGGTVDISISGGGVGSTASFATTSFSLSGSPNITVGTITATSLNASGIVTATSFVGSGANLTNLNIPVGFNELDAALFS